MYILGLLSCDLLINHVQKQRKKSNLAITFSYNSSSTCNNQKYDYWTKFSVKGIYIFFQFIFLIFNILNIFGVNFHTRAYSVIMSWVHAYGPMSWIINGMCWETDSYYNRNRCIIIKPRYYNNASLFDL
jgi:hypothetical protein